jgi:hypothetical protein
MANEQEGYLITFCVLSPNEVPDEIKESEQCRYRCYQSREVAEKALERYKRIYHQSLDLQIKPVRIIVGE